MNIDGHRADRVSGADPARPPAAIGVEIRALSKRYGDTVALDGLSVAARPGEILGVAGPNGSGKSTMIKILADEVRADAGEVLIDGQPWTPSIRAHGIAVVHQEPQLFPNLTVAENLLVGRERKRILQHDVNDNERTLLADLGIAEFADRRLGVVPLAVQQRTEIARALADEARILLFDEPNSALTEEESDDLFRRMHGLAARGHVVILVSHRLAELVAHADRVAMVIDGRCTTILERAELTQDRIARELVVGAHDGERPAAQSARSAGRGEVLLDLHGWTHTARRFVDITLALHRREVVAIVGVEGSGARELARSVAGMEPASGRVMVGGAKGRGASVDRTAFVSADRQSSLFPNLSVEENIVSRLGDEIAGRGGVLRRQRMATIGQDIRQRFGIKTETLTTPIGSLSGGNQQKVAIAAAIVKRPLVLVLEEPTRGVDVGSKREIYELLRNYANDDSGVVMFCTEEAEVFEAADRVHVVSRGRVSTPIPVSDYPDVESLAAELARLEEHGSRSPRATNDGRPP